ncbi:MAG: HlyD family efflux transporter periplasmic adaptor subunit [Planctomycetia bacterium]|nr:HlyD family efflux transporter periplasmic adaptor subunit [Planctomycetia bacterium]
MRSHWFGFYSVPVALTAFLFGCGKSPPPADSNTTIVSATPDTPNPDVGNPLFAATKAPNYAGVAQSEQIIIPNCTVQYEERQIVSAEVDGTIEIFATYCKPGEYEELMKTPEGKALIVYHPRDEKRTRPMRKVMAGDDVEAGQVLAYLDDQLIHVRMQGAELIKDAAGEAKVAATDGAKAAKARLDLTKKGVGVAASQSEMLDATITHTRFLENLAQAVQTIAKTEADYNEALVMLRKHQVRSGVKGIIRTISKRPGEYVKAGEKIMEIQSTERVRLEGNLDVEYAGLIKRGDRVVVEPALPSAPLKGHRGHRSEVTGIAVTAHTDGPLVVSVGADGAALVWDPNLDKKANRPRIPHALPHPVAVRSVAATPPAARGMLVITGADDGRIRVWDLTNRDKLPTSPKSEPAETHTSGVQAIAISPDGRFFATAAGRDVFIWELATAKKLYALHAMHRDSVTAVSFTPQNTLITASKDRSIKVWKLGADRAAVIRTIDHRAGVVDVLGVTRDGARVLFDQDKGRMDLVDPANGQTIGQIQNIGQSGAFSTFALFAPDHIPPGTPEEKLPPYFIATAGGEGDLKGTVQVWQAPRPGGRGSEIGRLITPGRVPVTTAAFSPVPDERFLVVGTTAGSVHLWKPPSEAPKKQIGRIVNIDATDARYVTVRIEMKNELGLLDRSSATVIVNP